MIIDAHCHIDLYEKPEEVLRKCEEEGAIILSMTNLPSHFEKGAPFFRHSKRARLSLGMHPLYSKRHKEEFPIFLRNLHKTSYIGEVGLDFSKEGIDTKATQVNTFNNILECISGQNKILSIHSRKAEKDVLNFLIKSNNGNAIFHWYTGPIPLISKILDAGYYFSINPSMIASLNGRTVISKIPLNRMLTESDGPFVKLNNRTIHPLDVSNVLEYISNNLNIHISEVENQIQSNFYEIINRIR